MKKLLLVTLFIVVTTVGCKVPSAAMKKESAAISMEYEALTRGSYSKVIVKQDTVITIKDREMKNVATSSLSKSDWNSLLSLLEKVDTDKLNQLKPPSTKHQFDGALLANLSVVRGDKTNRSTTFDHGNPPAEIKELVEKIISVSDLRKK